MADTVRGDVNTSATLSAGNTVSGTIEDFDLTGNSFDGDYFKLNLTAGHNYRFSATANVSSSDTLDAVRIRVRDSSGNIMSPDKTDASATPAIDFTPASGGTYFLAISASGGTTPENKTGSYQISLADNGTTTTDTVRGDINTSATLSAGNTVSGTIEDFDLTGNSFDGDYFKLNLTAGHNYRFSATANVSSSDTLDAVRIRVRDSSGNIMSPDKTDASATPAIDFTPASGGTYFLAISASGGTTPENKTGSYQISLADNGTTTTDTVRGDINTSATLSAGNTVSGTIEDFDLTGDAFDGDYFKLNLTAGHNYRFSATANVNSSDTLDAVRVRVRDSGGNIMSPDKTDASATPAIDFTPASGGTYFLAISASGGTTPENKTGSYQISLADNGTTTTDTVRGDINTSATLSAGNTVSGTIEDFDLTGDAFDGDYFKLNLTAGHNYRFSATANVNSSDTLDAVRVRVRDSGGNIMSPDKTDASATPAIDFTPASGGTYFLAISASGGTTPENKTGSYQISLADNGTTTTDTVRGDINTSATLSAGNTVSGTIEDFDLTGDAFDGDYFKLNLTAGHNYRFSATANVSSSDTLDAVRIRVRDSGGNIMSPDKTDASATPAVDFTPTSGGTYFLAISASGGTTPENKTGSYQISLADDGTSSTIDSVLDNANTAATLTSVATGAIDAEPMSGSTGNVSDGQGGFVDKDYYKVTLTAGHVYKFEGDAGVSATDTLDSIFIRLKDGNDSLLPVDKASSGSAPSFTYTATTSGTYLLAVSADGTGETWRTKTGAFQVKATDVGTQSSYSFGTSNKVVGESDGTVSFTLTRTNPVGNEVVYVTTWQNWNGNGDYNVGDYTGKVGANVTFLDGSLTASAPVTITIKPDQAPEAAQTFGLIATKAPNATLGDAIATTSFTITDDDSTPPPTGALHTTDQLFADDGGKIATLASFAVAAYVDQSAGDAMIDLKAYDGVPGQGWKILNSSDLSLLPSDYAGDHFINANAEAVVARSSNALVLAFRGTDFGAGVETVADVADWPFPGVHYSKFQKLITAVDKYVSDNHIQQVFVTGHSLGATMTHAYMAAHDGVVSGVSYDAVTIADPGYSGFKPNSNTINFLNEDDPVSIPVLHPVVLVLAEALAAALAAATSQPWLAGVIPYMAGTFIGHPGDQNYIHFGDANNDYTLFTIEDRAVQHYKILYDAIAPFLSKNGATESDLGRYKDIIVPVDSFSDGSNSISIGGGRYFNYGVPHNDTLTGSSNSELFVGGLGSDTYLFNREVFASPLSSNGHDSIIDNSGSADTIKFGPGITIRNVTHPDDDVVITYSTGTTVNSTITIERYEAGHSWSVVESGGTITLEALLQKYDHLADLNAASATAQSAGSSFNASNVFNYGLDANLPTGKATFRFGWDPKAPNIANLGSDSGFGSLAADGVDGTTQTIEGFRDLIGTDLGDRLIGDAQDNILYGGAGDDLVQAGGGADNVIGGDGPGNDTYDGGDGIDTVVYSSTTLGIVVNLAATQDHGSGPEIGTDQISNIENVVGGSGDDQITGDAAANQFTGGVGDDVLDGGAGNDIAIFSGTRAEYTLQPFVGGIVVSGADGVDTLRNIETLFFDDTTASGINQAPLITFAGGGDTAVQSLPEQRSMAVTVAASDPDLNPLSYSIVGGADQAKFTIDPSTGLLSFFAPNFETPADADHNNSYVVAVSASDGVLADIQTITVNITNATETSDFNGDGRGDILWRGADGTVGVWDMLNGGQAQAFHNFGAVTPSWHIAATGDFNGDGRSDILWRGDDGTVGVWEMLNGGQAQAFYNLGVVTPSWHIAGTGDFNGDGRSDILWRGDDGTVGVWDMANGGQVQDFHNLGVVTPSWHIAGTGDFNGDGRSDILWRGDDGTVAVWDMANGGQVQAFHNFGVTTPSWHIAGTGDFNGDGRSDILWRGDDGTVGVWDMLNGGQAQAFHNLGVVTTTWHIAGTEDLNGDGRSDILWRGDDGAVGVWDMLNGGQVQAFHNFGVTTPTWYIQPSDNNASAVFHTPAISSNGGGPSASVAVVENKTVVTTVIASDPDPRATLAFSLAGGADAALFQINASTGALSFKAAPSFEAPTDIDHNNGYVVQVRASDGSLFDDQVITVNVTDVREPPSDFNGDGRSDILWRGDDGTVAVWDMLNGGQAQAFHNFGVTTPSWHVAATGDFNGDGRSDILWRGDDGTVGVWDMLNGGQVQAFHNLGVVTPSWHIAGTGDFNGDGRSDILWRGDDGTVGVWDMANGGQAQAFHNLGVVTPSWHIAGTGDFNDDGRSDILWRGDDGTVAVWDMANGGEAQAFHNFGVTTPSWHIAGTGDFNGDRRSDILWRGDDGTVAVWDMANGGQAQAFHNFGAVTTSWHIAGTGDLNGDGRSDILWRGDDGTVGVWDMLNGGQVQAFHNFGVTTPSWHIQSSGHFDLI